MGEERAHRTEIERANVRESARERKDASDHGQT
jgi:hypothetical protein